MSYWLAYRSDRVYFSLVPSARSRVTVQLTAEEPPLMPSKTRSSLASRWKAARSGTASGRLMWVEPRRDFSPGTVTYDDTSEVSGMAAVPSTPRMPASRSWSMRPTGLVAFAILNGAPRLSSWMTIARALCMLSWLGPLQVIGWPKAITLSPQIAVAVPTPMADRSP